MKPELSITDYIKESDYMVQLSKSESYSYTAVESLSLGVPVIVNNFSVIGEIGIKDGENGYVLDMSMNNVDVNRIYNEIPNKFKYNGNEFNEEYLKLLGEEDKNRKDDDIVKVKCVFEDGFFDNEYGKHRKYGDIWTTDRQRAESLEYFSGPDFTKYKLIDIID